MCLRVREVFWEKERISKQGLRIVMAQCVVVFIPGYLVGVGTGTLGQKPANVVLVLSAPAHV